MRARGKGRILITGSIAGFMPGTFQAVYNGTKAFLDSFSFALRNELKDTGVTVTCLMPGATETEFFERADMMDTKVGTMKKDDPADVARTGFDAMMKGEGDVVDRLAEQAADGDRLGDAGWPPRRAAPQASRTWHGQELGSGYAHHLDCCQSVLEATLLSSRADTRSPTLPETSAVTLTINGEPRQLEVAPWTTLLDLLRLHLDLTGTKKGCDHGQCGACTVLVDGRRMNSCLQLAVMQEGREITTIEGLADGRPPAPVQAAFIEHDAFQCGYCTPGQICRRWR